MTNNDIVERLRGFWLPNDTPSLIRDEAADEILRLRKERDEARRSVCEMCVELGGVFRRVGGKTVEVTTAEGCAEIMRWDCFDSAPSDIEAHEVRGDLSGGNP